MRITSNGAICAVKAREQRRLEKYRKAQSRKEKNDAKKRNEGK